MGWSSWNTYRVDISDSLIMQQADAMEALGLKAGIYSDAGRNTCGSIYDADTIGVGVGLYGHDRQDCDFFFRDLGFDFIKVDYCGGRPHPKGDIAQTVSRRLLPS